MEPEPSEPDLPAAARVSGDICIRMCVSCSAGDMSGGS